MSGDLEPYLSTEGQTPTSLSGISALATRFNITRALVYSILARTWTVLAGPVSLVFVGRYLSREEQGFYYTFWSVLGLWVFFDLGLGLVIVQFASHERAALKLENGRMMGDQRARERLASLFHLALGWYGYAAALMLVVILPAGLVFFSHYRAPGVEVVWRLPWILVTLTATLNMLIGPLTSILEGSGLFHDMALMRLLQAVSANGVLWISLLLGADLYSAVFLNGTMLLFGAIWMFTRHRNFFLDLWSVKPAQDRIRWRAEIWPFQWRFAVSWITGYAMFQLLNPIVFATAGPVTAGQMGMSLMVATAIAMFAQAWTTTRAVDFGAFVAMRSFDVLDRVFRTTLWQSISVMILLSGGFLAVMEVLRRIGHPLAMRVLPPLPLVLLLLAMLLNHIVTSEATYLRAFKREAFLMIFVPMAAVATAGSFLLARRYGVTGMLSVLLASVALIGVGGGSLLFRARRREWCESHAAEDPEELPRP